MDKSKIQRRNIEVYDLIRIVATLLVVVGHGGILAWGLKSGVISPYSEFEASSLVAYIAATVKKIIYCFHMPLFVCLSGAIFGISNKPKNIKWIKKRAWRLLMPYFFVASFILIPVRIFVGYYDHSFNLLHILFRDVFLSYDVNYLWFLPMLFSLDLIFCVIQRVEILDKKTSQLGLLLLLLGISAGQFKIGVLPFQLHKTLEYMFWFYLGILMERNRNKWENVKLRHAIGLVVGFFVSALIYFQLEAVLNDGAIEHYRVFIVPVKMLIYYVMEFLGVVSTFLISARIGKGKAFEKCRIEIYSFDIYLLHVPIMMVVRKIIYVLIPSSAMSNVLYLFLLVLNIAIGVWGSILISIFARKVCCILRYKTQCREHS